jgi:hypothetical protein
MPPLPLGARPDFPPSSKNDNGRISRGRNQWSNSDRCTPYKRRYPSYTTINTLRIGEERRRRRRIEINSMFTTFEAPTVYRVAREVSSVETSNDNSKNRSDSSRRNAASCDNRKADLENEIRSNDLSLVQDRGLSRPRR